jgi:parallel beta-helix repeat protein
MKTCIKILLVVLSCSLCFAGSLQPTAAPAPTMKTLDQVEPRIPIPAGTGMATYTISTPGSYYFEGDRTATARGITISSANVTLDLMGYTLKGSDSGTNYGIFLSGDCNNVEIRNGTVRDFGSYGIYSNDYDAFSTRLIKLRVMSNKNRGVYLLSYSHLIQDCTFAENRYYGISINTGTISNCIVYNNNGYGINMGDSTIITDCVVYDNNGVGIDADDGCTITNCDSYNNNGTGINIGTGSTIDKCSSYSNSSHGFWLGLGTVITNSAANDNESYGIYLNSDCVVNKCSFSSNNDVGIFASHGSRISECTVSRNDDDGIYVSGSNCAVIGNNCVYNGAGVTDGAGIRAISTQNRLESNAVNGNDYGIAVTGTNNFVVKNSASANTSGNYSIAAGNSYGPIADVAGDGDISGTANANHPWANFIH